MLILVRHGETPWNYEKRIVGHTEIGLNETGHRQAASIAEALREEKISAIYCSPLMRARETAAYITSDRALKTKYVDELKEFDAGELNGLTLEDVRQRYGDFFDMWMEGEPDMKMPGGESKNDLKHRVLPAMERIIDKHQTETVVVVSHTMIILTVLNYALGMNPVDFRRLRLTVGSITVLNYTGDVATLSKFNDTCHWR